MTNSLVEKIAKIVGKNEVSEDEMRSLMILIRKVLETMPENDRKNYLILNLFCDWVAHIKITKSNIGLRILAKINDALVDMRHSGDGTEIGIKMSEVLFVGLRRELKAFLNNIKVSEVLMEDNKLWSTVFIIQLLGAVQDVPLSFPSINDLDSTKVKIYEKIAKNAIKLGAGVMSIWISNVDFAALGAKSWGDRLCLYIKTEDTTTIVVPMVIDARLR